jgi:16S rRNA processing protein RimM
MDNYIQIGTLVATYGVDGEFILRHNLGKKTSFKVIEAFFLETGEGRFLPYFPLEVRIKNSEEVYLRLEGIHTKEKARMLLKKGVWLEDSIVRKLAAKNAPLSLLGYMVVEEGRELAPVLEVIEQPLQILLRLEMQGKEVLIPLHETTLIEIDHKNKKVKVNLPEGLLDVYLT